MLPLIGRIADLRGRVPVLIAALVAGVLAVANLLAAAPALLAARSDPARLLRAE